MILREAMIRKKKFVFAAAVILVLYLAILYVYKINLDSRGYINNIINKLEGKTLNKEFITKIKSGNLSTDYNIQEAIEDIDKLQLNTINVPVAINIDNLSSSNMTVDNASKNKAIELIKKLRGKKINIILEPYPWIANGSKVETDWNPDNINDFFWNWKTKILKSLIDDIAIPYHVDAMYIGSSFEHMEYAEGYWCETIDYVRKYYKGLITYKTSWWRTAKWEPQLTTDYDKKINNIMFSKLDFIAIAAYFELTSNSTNTTENIVDAIESTQIYDRKQNVKKEIKDFYDKWEKPIFFGELGFPKIEGASIFPWNPYQNNIINNSEQSRCFEAYKIAFEKENWNLGFSVFAIGEHSLDKLYYPSDESAKVIRYWYNDAKKK
jgi:hypothetical protein